MPLFKPVTIPATGEWQLLEMNVGGTQCYILVHPNGRQAWFREDDIADTIRKNWAVGKFKFTDQPLRDLKKLADVGLRPFHVDPDFGVAQFLTVH